MLRLSSAEIQLAFLALECVLTWIKPQNQPVLMVTRQNFISFLQIFRIQNCLSVVSMQYCAHEFCRYILRSQQNNQNLVP